jgi:hypothetical protein
MSVSCIDKYDLEAWIFRLGSTPVERVAHEDKSGSYEMNQAHVYRLENGRFALVTESGCSCYSNSDADIDLFPDQAAAMASFEKWQN